MEGTPDLATMVKLILDNPTIMEQISSMAGKRSESEPSADIAAEERTDTRPTEISAPEPQRSEASNRSRLISAMKPYLSENRAKAVESMLMVADILGGMKRR